MVAALKENNPWAGIALGVVLTAIAGYILFVFENQSTQISAHDRAISALQADELSTGRDISRLEGAITAMQANVTTMIEQTTSIKASTDAQTEAFHGLEKKVDDLDAWLRPLHPPPGR
jgi:uncharacterized membrane protein YvbJ